MVRKRTLNFSIWFMWAEDIGQWGCFGSLLLIRLLDQVPCKLSIGPGIYSGDQENGHKLCVFAIISRLDSHLGLAIWFREDVLGVIFGLDSLSTTKGNIAEVKQKMLWMDIQWTRSHLSRLFHPLEDSPRTVEYNWLAWEVRDLLAMTLVRSHLNICLKFSPHISFLRSIRTENGADVKSCHWKCVSRPEWILLAFQIQFRLL